MVLNWMPTIESRHAGSHMKKITTADTPPIVSDEVGAGQERVEADVEFCRALRAKGRPERGQPADKTFRDGLYERE